jgi:hypothetical protein
LPKRYVIDDVPEGLVDGVLGRGRGQDAAPNLLERMELGAGPRGCPGMTTKDQEARIDEALKESFPASDPPSFVGAGAPAGSPPVRKKPGDWGQDYGSASFSNSKPWVFSGRE